jgi:ABC-2 type transport system permease protein
MSAATVDAPRERSREPIAGIPTGRLVSIELRKMFDTRSGFWLMCSIGILSLLATIAVIVFGHGADIKYSNFAAAIGIPIGILLPVVAVLAVTSEWSQRSGLTTFTLVPHRSRVIAAKLYAAILVGILSVVLALLIAVLGELVGAAIRGVPLRWDSSFVSLVYVLLGNVLGLLIGFMLGVLIRNSPAAIVGYFVYDFVIPTIFMVLANATHWFEKAQPWIDFRNDVGQLFNNTMPASLWIKLVVSGVIWLVIPLAIGLRLVLRSEVK